ncbi:MAG: histone deacetylase family protein [Candidatus Thorarchaeota archaeon]
MPWSDIALITHPGLSEHVMPFPRPHLESFETPLRVQLARRLLKEHGLLQLMRKENARLATISDVRRVHSDYLIDLTQIMSGLGSGEIGESAYASPVVYRSALLAAGGAIRAAELVVSDKVRHAFSLMRPPGHHASTSTAMGLCYFNNIAIAIRRLQKKHDITKVSIIDFDDHFGNGTAEIFYNDPSVQYISIHEYDYENYGMGHYAETGASEGAGTNTNIPLVDNASDNTYRQVVDRIIVPAVTAFQPEIIAVSAGFDAHYADPVGNMNIDSSTFWYFGDRIRRLVDDLDARGSFWALEGGYNLFVLGLSIEASLRGLAGEKMPRLEDQIPRDPVKAIENANEQVIDQVLDVMNQYWSRWK